MYWFWIWQHQLTLPVPPYRFFYSQYFMITSFIDSLYSFILFMGFSRQEYWSGLLFPSPVDHILSELSTMIHLSWVALDGMAHSFIELDKAVVHMIRLVSFLWLWFSVCLPSDGKKIRGLWKLPVGRDWLRGKLGLVLMGGAIGLAKENLGCGVLPNI